MRRAQQEQADKERMLVEQHNKQMNDKNNAKSRGTIAIERERKINADNASKIEDIKQIERKKLVLLQENSIAHEQAKKY
jgi:hypothetical protein